jgi:AcrR family transcriptional regulator
MSKRLTREDKRANNRGLILRAAREVFGRRGYHAATIEEIADEAGLSNGAIYYNFKNKEDLFLALLDERIQDRAFSVASMLDATDAGTQAHDVISSIKANRTWRLLFLEFVTYAARNPRFARQLRVQRAKMRTALSETIERQFPNRPTGDVPPDRLSLILIALANGLAIEELTNPGSVPEDLISQATTLLLGPAREPKRKS